MPGNSVMQEIRDLLSQGKPSSEVIALGYKPPTVYKVQRQLRKKGQDSNKEPAPQNRPAPVSRQGRKVMQRKLGLPLSRNGLSVMGG